VAQVNDVGGRRHGDDPAMGQLAGCATFGRYLALMLLAAMTAAFLFLARPSGFGPLVNQGAAVTRTRSTPGAIAAVSDRHFASGSAHGVATGDLTLDLSLPIDRDKAYAQDGLAWIAFGNPGDPDAILVSLDEPENSVAISRNGDTALGVGEQCHFAITVTEDLVSGTIMCPEADALRGGTKVGVVSIDVSFSAGP
jgi:hypothetical protein